jgi:hypothetical protein
MIVINWQNGYGWHYWKIKHGKLQSGLGACSVPTQALPDNN